MMSWGKKYEKVEEKTEENVKEKGENTEEKRTPKLKGKINAKVAERVNFGILQKGGGVTGFGPIYRPLILNNTFPRSSFNNVSLSSTSTAALYLNCFVEGGGGA
jgi:hypothetical protein